MTHKPMSLESVLDEERREVLALLAASPRIQPRASTSSAMASSSRRAPSPLPSPRSPVRSMLDIGGPEDMVKQRSSSAGSISAAIPNAPRVSTPVRSMLDVDSRPRPAAVAQTRSGQSSPVEERRKASIATSVPHRSLSDAAARPAGFGPRAPTPLLPKANHPSAYQFTNILSSNPGGPIVPKRNTQAGKKSSISSVMADMVRGSDLSQYGLGGSRDSGRSNSIAGTGLGGKSKSKSPHNRLGLRSGSPHAVPLILDPSKLRLDDGSTLDSNNAYRKLSDANILRAGGGLLALADKSQKNKADNGEQVGSDGGRLQTDYTPVDEQPALPESSSDEDDDSSSDEARRGRRNNDITRDENGKDGDPESSTLGMGRVKGYRTPKSLLAAAEEERKQVSSQQTGNYKVRSMIIDPVIHITTPSGERSKSKSSGVHPNTSFEDRSSGTRSPADSDAEGDISDIRRAQKMSVNMTTIVSTPVTSRCVRTIFRGDFAKMQQEADENQRRVRKYVVATDLSPEAQHALEWTVGTVLRDGDTLLSIYCIDEELAGGKSATEASSSAADTQQKQQAEAVAALIKPSTTTPILGPAPGSNTLSPGFKLDPHGASATSAPLPKDCSKAEKERFDAVQEITSRVAKLLRKTKLQVKVVIEVVHCKSPKHLIVEIIDYISPTLVILGSRGRSALKGAILGSFSNYLVTKSSVPVMVARKRLRKHTKFKPLIRLTNNIPNPIKSLDYESLD